MYANYADTILESGQDLSYPGRGYFNSVQTNIYDDKRQALYQTSIGHAPDLGQKMRFYFAISRDNGQTWSQPIDISNRWLWTSKKEIFILVGMMAVRTRLLSISIILVP